ncbi:MAG TPA: OmpA family protein [Vicinamibacterales bacterium]|nr:OmpA family protein [Vicinamibacterales bacterium]
MRTKPRLTWLLLGVLAAGPRAVAQGPPDKGKVLDLEPPRVLDIVGVTLGVNGLLKDLGATVTDRQVRISLSADVLFDFDSYALKPEATATLQKVADVVKSYGTSPVLIEGHTDGKGDDAYNMTLSERRADAVKRWLVSPGRVDTARMTTKGWGKTKPVAPNTTPDGKDDPAGRQKNRRVEITVTKAQ